jgi:F-type H+-transporting ATPase subunit a
MIPVSGKGCLILLVVILIPTLLCAVSSGFLGSLGIGTALDGLAKPTLPTILLPAEKIPADGIITNTLIATVLADIVILVLFGLGLRRLRSNPGDLVPRGRLHNLLEMLVEGLYGLAESVLGGNARKVFWVGATIFVFVLVANWMELLPGFDSIGIIEPAHGDIQGYEKGAFLGIPALVGPLEEHEGEGEAHSEEGEVHGEEGEAHAEEGEAHAEEEHADHGYILRPFLRAANTDLNTTLALALISVVLTQVYSIRELGLGGYLGRFIQTKRIGEGNPMGGIDFFVGILESIAEFAKIISFTFRLFGNIFAGQVLLFVMGFLIPFVFFGVLIFWGLEIFVGAIQALVFMMLTFVFMAVAMSHHGDEHEAEH